MKTGLVSVSFRKNTPHEIISAAKAAGLDGIEWGSDVHSPNGDIPAAEKIAVATRDAGLIPFSYGAYYRLGNAGNSASMWSGYADSARALGTKVIRVWAGEKNADEMTADEYAAVVRDARAICAQSPDITVSLECHNNTVTVNYESALRFLDDVGAANLKMYWQPNQLRDDEYNLAAARALRDVTVNVHAFNWHGTEKLPLSDGYDIWRRYAEIFADSALSPAFMLEFMPDGRIESLPEEAAALKNILAGFN